MLSRKCWRNVGVEAEQEYDSLNLRKSRARNHLDDGLVGKRLGKVCNTKERFLV